MKYTNSLKKLLTNLNNSPLFKRSETLSFHFEKVSPLYLKDSAELKLNKSENWFFFKEGGIRKDLNNVNKITPVDVFLIYARIPFLDLETGDTIAKKFWKFCKSFFESDLSYLFKLLNWNTQTIFNQIIFETDFYFKIDSYLITALKKIDYIKPVISLSKKQIKRVWSNKLDKWLIIKTFDDIEELELLKELTEETPLLAKIHLIKGNTVFQEWLYPYDKAPNPQLLNTNKELLEKFFYDREIWGYSDIYENSQWIWDDSDFNWGWEILGWEDRERTKPRLGMLKNFDPLYKETED
jgi:hypothetical protein